MLDIFLPIFRKEITNFLRAPQEDKKKSCKNIYPCLEVIYNVLVNDLKRLEVGVKMNVMSVGRDIKCGVICYSADNLEVRNQVLITNLSLHLRFPKIMVKPVSPHFKDRE